ncbi:hypothetical protein DSO57_1017323 [Entomophthora muscae]|uniref:Uncharacterized protein n=1 Tax=Entomophthora muscae TaxID=34485 RepID=A0ACC2RVQ2_9FUNG|nr:hypothetical protein DSO57_1017323 [Entomophthora muscae]
MLQCFVEPFGLLSFDSRSEVLGLSVSLMGFSRAILNVGRGPKKLMPQRSNIFSTTIGLASFYVLNGLAVHPWPLVGCFKLFHSGALTKMSVFLVCFCEYLCPFVLSRDFVMNSLASSLEFNFNFEMAVSTNFLRTAWTDHRLQCSFSLGHVECRSHS